MSEPTSKHKEESAVQQALDSPAAAKGLDDSYQPVPDVRDDPAYFARLYDQYATDVLRVCYFYLSDRGAFTTTSGDINIEADANDVQISTVSGDVEIHGDYDHLKFASTSGDVELEAKVRQCDFSSVSGDLDLRFTGALSLINGSTTSGDIDVELPDDTGTNNIDVHSRSGDISMRRSGRRGSRTVTGSIRSVSGDIEIR